LTLLVGVISVRLCTSYIVEHVFHAFISKCDFFDEGKVKIHYYVSHILGSHVSGSVQGDLNTYMFNLLSEKNSVVVPHSVPYI
jgi:hypothetical protein